MRSKHRKRNRLIAGVLTGLLLLSCFAIALLNSISVSLSGEDRLYIGQFLKDWHITKAPEEVHKSFRDELDFISLVQDSVLSNITGEQIPNTYVGNVCYYYKKRQGICYDHALLIEKILLFYKFRFRHVYMYFKEGEKVERRDFFRKDIQSHAAVEVKTQKGWMAIGTDANWLGIDGNDKLLTYFDIREKIKESGGNPVFKKPASFGNYIWNIAGYNFRIIYGIYSRHGDFFTDNSSVQRGTIFTGKRHFLPDYNLRMLLYNL